MPVFQSLADIAISSTLAIAYIITFVIQRRHIKILKETAKSHADLSSSQSLYIDTLKKMFTPSDLEGLISSKVKIEEEKQKEVIREFESNKSLLHSISQLCVDSWFYIYVESTENVESVEVRDTYIKKVLPGVAPLCLPVFHEWDKRLSGGENSQISKPNP